MTVEELRHWMGMREDGVDLLARVDGLPVGVGQASPKVDSPTATYGMASVRVLPEHRRLGIGTALLAAGSAHARALGKVGLELTMWEDDPAAAAFAAHHR